MYKKIFKSMCLLTVITLVFSVAITLVTCYRQFNNRIKTEVQYELQLVAKSLNLTQDNVGYLTNIKDTMVDKRFTLIDKNGKVLFDNDIELSKTENHNDRPEVIEARKNGIGESQRTSVTMGTGVYYYALKLNDDMIIRIASATNDVLKIFVGISIPAIVIISIIYMLTVVVAMSLTKNITKPILDIDLDEKIETDNVYDELAPFVTKIRQQNKKINKQLDKLNIQKIRLGVITDNMSEGLIVINNEMTVLSVNKSVANMFRLEDNDIKGKNFLYITRDMHINDCVKLTLLGQKGILEFTQNGKNY
ncbi:MAG: PAS domain-containing protein, partial [Oscillospiraceae bacterium]